MEKIIDGILSELRFTRKWFDDFCSVNKLDKSSHPTFNSSLQIALSRLNSERETLKKNIPENKSKGTRGINFVTTWGDYDSLDNIHSNKKTNRNIYPTKLLALNKKIYYLESILLYVKEHPEKESTLTKENENNVPGLMQFDEPLKSKIDEINRMIYNSELGKDKKGTVIKDIRFHLSTFYEKNFQTLYFTKTFSSYESFLRRVFPHLKIYFSWDVEKFVSALQKKL
jgi:hypothetical protein